MNDTTIFPQLDIPETLAAGPGPGNTDPRVLARFAQTGLADHMQADVLRGMIECKEMLRQVWGTKNTYTYGVGGTGFSGLDCMLGAILPGDTVVAFVNGTFSGIDGLTIRMKAATREELAANAMDPQAASVTIVTVPHGQSVTGEIVEKALAEKKPKWAFMAHWETGSGRINDLQGFSDACVRHGAMGLVDAVSSLGIADFSIDAYPGVVRLGLLPAEGRALPAPDLCAGQLHRSIHCPCAGPMAAPPTSTTRSLKPATGASWTARMWRRAPITAPIRAMPSPPSTRLCASRFSMAAPGRPATMRSMKRRCATRLLRWAAQSHRT